MYFVLEKYLDTLTGKYRKNVISEKEQISKEQEQSKKDLSTVCDCESYCDKYKPTKPLFNGESTNSEDKGKKITKDEPNQKNTNMFDAVLTLFGKKDSDNKKEKIDSVVVDPEKDDESEEEKDEEQKLLIKKEDTIQEKNEMNTIESETHEFQILKVKNKYLH